MRVYMCVYMRVYMCELVSAYKDRLRLGSEELRLVYFAILSRKETAN